MSSETTKNKIPKCYGTDKALKKIECSNCKLKDVCWRVRALDLLAKFARTGR